jgi:hypothetical protein
MENGKWKTKNGTLKMKSEVDRIINRKSQFLRDICHSPLRQPAKNQAEVPTPLLNEIPEILDRLLFFHSLKLKVLEIKAEIDIG